ncbi:MAG: tetratricopeptide repeat protein [Acidobacteria bacterium]|nr:tetratricopeptide repeat protein [Acidobacteriota bacterium]
MRSFVFTNEALTRQAGRFVWLSINTETEQGAAFKAKFPINAIPTLFILDPASGEPALRWVGAATVSELEKLLDDGERAVRSAANGSEVALRKADRLYGEGKYAEAAGAYKLALDSAPTGWAATGRATASLAWALSSSDEYQRCAELARDSYPKLGRSAPAANVAATGLDCALSLPLEAPGRKELVAELEGFCRAVLADKDLPIAADDRAGIYSSLVDAREDAGDKDGMMQTAQAWAAFLEIQAAAAATPEQRAVFDAFRLTAYLTLELPEKAVPMLQASERDLPDDYNPPARLALAYKAMSRYDDAIAASTRALAKVYGPRKIRVLLNLADIYSAKGDAPAARKILEESLQIAESLPAGQRSEGMIAMLKKKLESPAPPNP